MKGRIHAEIPKASGMLHVQSEMVRPKIIYKILNLLESFADSFGTFNTFFFYIRISCEIGN